MTPAGTDRRRARSTGARRELIVKARDLDNDDKSIQALTVVRPTSEAGQRTQLIEVVSRLHPDADFRSFGNGGATFLDRQHLIVAYYGATVPEDPAHEAEDRAEGEQQALFHA